MTEKIILDTDIGSDIDDAICLAYLLANPGCELLGITTVTGEAELRARVASAVCRVANKPIPIFPGNEKPMFVEQRQPRAPQAEALDQWDHEHNFPKGEAIAFLRETIRKDPGEITLLTIGPLTNIAALFLDDPNVISMIKELVSMCGVFTGVMGNAKLEWNARLDPHATAIVYRAQTVRHRSIGLDVTTRLQMSADEARSRFQARLLKPVLDFAEVWFKDSPQITFHDPLAATVIFDPAICQFTQGQVDVEVSSPTLGGLTQFLAKPDGNHEVATDVSPDKFFNHFFSYF